MIKNNFVQ